MEGGALPSTCRACGASPYWALHMTPFGLLLRALHANRSWNLESCEAGRNVQSPGRVPDEGGEQALGCRHPRHPSPALRDGMIR
jgi:hypothetical protein